jgi:hypothetical protein
VQSEDDSKFATFATVSTDATGNYTLKTRVAKTYFYRAVVAETDVCDDETSNSQKVRVQKKKAAQESYARARISHRLPIPTYFGTPPDGPARTKEGRPPALRTHDHSARFGCRLTAVSLSTASWSSGDLK